MCAVRYDRLGLVIVPGLHHIWFRRISFLGVLDSLLWSSALLWRHCLPTLLGKNAILATAAMFPTMLARAAKLLTSIKSAVYRSCTDS